MSDQGREAHLGTVLRYAVAAASLGAGLIHVTAVFDHRDHVVVAAFFVALAVVQVGWAVAVVRHPSGGALKAGAAISAGVVAIWLLSRTTGLPGVPGAEEPEAFGFKDGMASLLEVLLAAGVAVQFVPGARGLRLASGRLASALAVSAVGVLTVTGLSAAGHDHHRGGGAHDHLAAAGDHSPGDNGAGHDGGAHGHGGAGAHGHDTASSSSEGHRPESISGAEDHSGHPHGAGGQHETGGHAHLRPAGARAAGVAGHDHDAPGHLHDPAHHHEPGHVHDPSHHHEPGHADDPAHDPDQPGHSDPAGGHDHRGGDHQHGGGDPGDAETCTSPFPANQVVTTLQETAQSTVGAGCRLQTASPTDRPHRHSPLHRSAHHFIS